MRVKQANLCLLGVGLGAFLFHFGGFWSATWWSKWGFLMLCFDLFFAAWASRRTSGWYFPLMIWVLCASTVMAFWAQNFYGASFDPLVVIVLQKDALFTWITCVACAWVFASFRGQWNTELLFQIIWAAGCSAFLSMPKGMPPNNGWYFGNPSMAGCLLAALLPFVWCGDKKAWSCLAWILTAVVIWRTETSIPIGVLAAVTWVYWGGLKSGAAIALLGLGGYFLLGKDFLDDNGRFPIYRLALAWTKDHGTFTTGWGAGAAQTLMPIIQILHKHRLGDYFLWLHNDWLQIGTEFGWPGLLFALIAVCRLAVLGFNNKAQPAFLASLCGFMAMGLFNYPLRMPLTALCLLLICCQIESAQTG